MQTSSRIGLIFPGQGAQQVGMGRLIFDRYPLARELFERASAVLGYDIREVCFNGPIEKLNATEFSQPALFLTSAIGFEVLSQEQPDLLGSTVACGGLSLGEYTAVYVAGVLSFEETLDLVQRRGRAMQKAADQAESGMSSVLGLDLAKLTEVCRQAAMSVGHAQVCVPANILCPGNIATSGHRAALKKLEELALEAGAMKVVPLSVAGAFHTSLMEPAVAELKTALEAKTMNVGRIPVVSNVDAEPHVQPNEIRELLAKQIVTPVLWEACVRRMIRMGVNKFVEIGTGKVLRGLLKRIDRTIPADGFEV
jgi:[acyl-carrier-protein] S-malonyltransferase